MVDVLGIGLTLLAAGAIAAQTTTLRVGTEGGRSSDALVVVLLVNVAVLVPAAAVLGYPDYHLPLRALGAFAGAGIVGTMLGRAFYFEGITRVGASRAEPVKASMPLHSAILAVLVLGEVLTPQGAVGIVLIVIGVAAISWESAGSRSPGEFRTVELLFPLGGAFFYGIEPVFAKVGFAEGTSVVVALAVKTCAATIAFLAYLRARGTLPEVAELKRGNTRWYLAAGVANTTFLVSYYAALSVAPVVLVSPIMQMSPLLVLAISYLFLKRLETVTWRLVAGALVVVAGGIAVSLA